MSLVTEGYLVGTAVVDGSCGTLSRSKSIVVLDRCELKSVLVPIYCHIAVLITVLGIVHDVYGNLNEVACLEVSSYVLSSESEVVADNYRHSGGHYGLSGGLCGNCSRLGLGLLLDNFILNDCPLFVEKVYYYELDCLFAACDSLKLSVYKLLSGGEVISVEIGEVTVGYGLAGLGIDLSVDHAGSDVGHGSVNELYLVAVILKSPLSGNELELVGLLEVIGNYELFADSLVAEILSLKEVRGCIYVELSRLGYGNCGLNRRLSFGNCGLNRRLSFGNCSLNRRLSFGNCSLNRRLGYGNCSLYRRLGYGNCSLNRRLSFGNCGLNRRLSFGNCSLNRRLSFGNCSLNRRLSYGSCGSYNCDSCLSAQLSGIVEVAQVENCDNLGAVIVNVNIDVLAVERSVECFTVGSYEAILGSTEVEGPAAVYSELDLIVKILVDIVEYDLIYAGSYLLHLIDVVVGIPVYIVEPVILTVTNCANNFNSRIGR